MLHIINISNVLQIDIQKGIINMKDGGNKMNTAKTATMNVRIQENVKDQAESILNKLGLTRTTAIDLFYRQIIMNNGIPFPLEVKTKMPISREEMAEKEFNDFMELSLEQAKNNKSMNIDEAFQELQRGL